MLPARRVCASRTRGSAHTWLRAADICQHDAPTLMGSTGRKPNNDRLTRSVLRGLRMEPAMVAAGAWRLSRLNFPAQVVQRAPWQRAIDKSR